MGLLSILKKVKEKEHEVRVLMLYALQAFALFFAELLLFFCIIVFYRGLDNAGKTTVVKKFKGEDVGTISPTLGFSISTFEFQG